VQAGTHCWGLQLLCVPFPRCPQLTTMPQLMVSSAVPVGLNGGTVTVTDTPKGAFSKVRARLGTWSSLHVGVRLQPGGTMPAYAVHIAAYLPG